MAGGGWGPKDTRGEKKKKREATFNELVRKCFQGVPQREKLNSHLELEVFWCRTTNRRFRTAVRLFCVIVMATTWMSV